MRLADLETAAVHSAAVTHRTAPCMGPPVPIAHACRLPMNDATNNILS